MMGYQSTKRGKPVRRPRFRAWGFHWYGRDDRGVSIWDGDRNALKWTGRLLSTLGVAQAVVGAVAAIISGSVDETAGVFLVGSFVLCGVAWILLREAQRFGRMNTLKSLAADLNVPVEELERVAEEQGVRPSAIVNGEPHYAPQDLGPAATLLRSASAPGESLLRPARGLDTSEVELLRPAGLNSEQVSASAQLQESRELRPGLMPPSSDSAANNTNSVTNT